MISYEIWTLKEKETKLQACTQIAKKSMKQLLTTSQKKFSFSIFQQLICFLEYKSYKQSYFQKVW